MTKLLHDERENASRRITDQMLDEVLSAIPSFVARGYGVAERNPVVAHVYADHRRQGATLRNDNGPGAFSARLWRRNDKRQRNGIDVVDNPEAIRT